MNDTNYVMMEGRLIADPEMRVTPEGVAICDVHMANNRYSKQKPDGEQAFQQYTTYVKITMRAEKAMRWGEFLKQGDKIFVVGKLVDDNYRMKDTGISTRGRLKIDHIEKIAVIERAKVHRGDAVE